MAKGETWGGWTTKFFRALGAPDTKENRACIWAIIEREGSTFTWNPLAISGVGTGANSSGVANIDTEANGIIATVNFLNAVGHNDYPGRVKAPLQRGDGLAALHGMDASGAWAGDFPDAYSMYNRILDDTSLGGAYGSSPLIQDPGHGEGDIGGTTGTGIFGGNNPIDNTISGVANAVTNPVDQLISAFQGVGHFFAVLSQRSTWVRIGEILGGIILIAFAVGVMRNDIYAPAKQGSSLLKKAVEVGAVVG